VFETADAPEDEMSVDEIERLLQITREFGIRSVKFTGASLSFAGHGDIIT